jgi:hypothetical protein
MTTLPNKTQGRRVISSLVAATALLAVGVNVNGCAADFDSSAIVNTLRVIGIQKDKPYAKPGDEVNLAALWTDANERPAGEVTFWWIAGCNNPIGDLYGCFPLLNGGDAIIGTGNEFNFTIPEDIITSHAPPEPGVTPYGISYVWFGACAGDLKKVPIVISDGSPTLPFACFDKETGEQLTQKDFVAGYTTIFAYDELTHRNPSITGFSYVGEPITPDCIGVECVSEEPESEPACDDPATICVPACEADDDSCPSFPISPIITRSPPVVDPRTIAGEEQIWVAYLSDGATFTKDLTLVKDRDVGWIDDYSTEFQAPAEPGLIYIWAVVRDTLGGQNWVRIKVLVQ